MISAAETRPLRILSVVNVPWDSRLGAARVWMELGAEWQRAGHRVEKFCLSDAFPGDPKSPPLAALRLLKFPSRAAAYLRAHASEFDVVDALVGTLPFTKQSLRFRGLLVARSVGLYHSYDKFEREMRQRWPATNAGTPAGRVFYRFVQARNRVASRRSLECADLLNVPNEAEASVVRDELRIATRTVVEPYGLPPAQAEALARHAQPPEQRLRNREVCFLGMWSPRKGSRDWQQIIALIRERVPDARFLFLGTMIEDEAVLRDIGSGDGVKIVADYQPEDLPRLLSTATVGAFPSYIEGFGIAVIEQLAAGIPVVAYDCAGPHDILASRLTALLSPTGAPVQFAQKIADLLLGGIDRYRALAGESRATAAEYSWPQIAARTSSEYERSLQHLRAGQ